MSIEKNIRDNVRRLRDKKGWTHDEMSVQADKSLKWSCHIESGKIKALPHLELFAEVFGVDPVDLIIPKEWGDVEMNKQSAEISMKYVLKSFVEGFVEDYST